MVLPLAYRIFAFSCSSGESGDRFGFMRLTPYGIFRLNCLRPYVRENSVGIRHSSFYRAPPRTANTLPGDWMPGRSPYGNRHTLAAACFRSQTRPSRLQTAVCPAPQALQVPALSLSARDSRTMSTTARPPGMARICELRGKISSPLPAGVPSGSARPFRGVLVCGQPGKVSDSEKARVAYLLRVRRRALLEVEKGLLGPVKEKDEMGVLNGAMDGAHFAVPLGENAPG